MEAISHLGKLSMISEPERASRAASPAADDDADAAFARRPKDQARLDRKAARAAEQEHKRKYKGRKKGTLNKKTLEKLRLAEREVVSDKTGRPKRLAIDHMDEMIEWFRELLGKLQPFDADGKPREGYNSDIWFRAVNAFQGFLSMRAPYQSPRLSAVAIMPAQHQQRTTVNVTILNERGEKVFADNDRAENSRLIEHDAGNSPIGENGEAE